MKHLVQSFYNWYRQALRHAKYRWIVIGASLLYLVSPFDISPDFIPILGWIDDGVLATLLVSEVSQLVVENLNRRKRTAPMTEPEQVIEVPAE